MPTAEILTQADADVVKGFWKSEDGLSVIAGLRLDRALPRYIANAAPFDNFTDAAWQDFYKPRGRYEAIKVAVLACWPNGGAR